MNGSLEPKLLPEPPSLWQRVRRHYPLKLLVGIFLLFCLWLVIWLVPKQSRLVAWRLVDYAPKSSWVYIEFGSSQAFAELGLKQTRLARKIDQALRNLGLSQQLVNSVDQLALLGVVNEDEGALADRLDWLWLVRAPDPKQIELLLPADSFFMQLDNNIAAWSVAESAMRTLKAAKPYRRSLVNTQDPSTIWYGFINPAALVDGLAELPTENLRTQTLVAWLDKLFETNWEISLSSNQLTISLDNLLLGSKTESYRSSLTPETDLLVNGANLGKALSNIEAVMEQDLPLHAQVWQALIKQLEVGLELSWAELLELIDRQATLQLGFESELREGDLRRLTGLFDKLSLHFVIDFKEQLSEPERFELQELARKIIARASPSEIKRELPDGTTAVHLVAEPDKLSYKSLGLAAGFSATDELIEDSAYLSSLNNQYEIVFAHTRDSSLISNASTTLRNYLDEARHIPVPACGDLADESVSELVYISDNILNTLPLLQDFSSLVAKLNKANLNICLQF